MHGTRWHCNDVTATPGIARPPQISTDTIAIASESNRKGRTGVGVAAGEHGAVGAVGAARHGLRVRGAVDQPLLAAAAVQRRQRDRQIRLQRLHMHVAVVAVDCLAVDALGARWVG